VESFLSLKTTTETLSFETSSWWREWRVEVYLVVRHEGCGGTCKEKTRAKSSSTLKIAKQD